MGGTDDRDVRVHKGFFPAVIGRDVHVREAGGMILLARQNMSVTQGGAQWLVAGRDQTLEQSGGAVLVSRQASVTNGFVGLVIAGRVTMAGTARALVTLSAPAAAAAVAGLLVGLAIGRRGTT